MRIHDCTRVNTMCVYQCLDVVFLLGCVKTIGLFGVLWCHFRCTLRCATLNAQHKYAIITHRPIVRHSLRCHGPRRITRRSRWRAPRGGGRVRYCRHQRSRTTHTSDALGGTIAGARTIITTRWSGPNVAIQRRRCMNS